MLLLYLKKKQNKTKLPPKCQDPSPFTILDNIDNTKFERQSQGLGVLTNVIPYSIYNSLNLGLMKEVGIIIQYVNRFNAYPKGILEDILVQVNELVFLLIFISLEQRMSHCPILRLFSQGNYSSRQPEPRLMLTIEPSR